MNDLSPAAQAIARAAGDSEPGIYATIAAALRAAADQLTVRDGAPRDPWEHGFFAGVASAQQGILALAAEFEADE